MIKILRIEQWAKNLIILIPAILSSNFEVFYNFEIYIVFISFSLLASSTYILNDIKDLEQDKIHPEKKFRPLASGSLNLNTAYIYSISLFIVSFLITYIVNYKLLTLYLIYLGITLTYSSKLKYIKYLDFLSITTLFSIRILIGANATRVELTTSFILFLLFVLTLISIGKKLSILNNKQISHNSQVKSHLIKSYRPKELHNLSIFSSLMSLIIFTFWSYQNIELYSSRLLVSIVSIILLYLFNKSFIKDSVNAKTENFVNWVITSKNLFKVVLLCLLTLIIIY